MYHPYSMDGLVAVVVIWLAQCVYIYGDGHY